VRASLAIAIGLLWLTACGNSVGAQRPLAPERAVAREIFQQLIEIPTTQADKATPKAAQAMADRLTAAGFPREDVRVLTPEPGVGGHSSLPRADNPIYELSAALQRLAAYQFPLNVTEVAREFLDRSARVEMGQRAPPMGRIHGSQGSRPTRRPRCPKIRTISGRTAKTSASASRRSTRPPISGIDWSRHSGLNNPM
jgi:hypothetical protein